MIDSETVDSLAQTNEDRENILKEQYFQLKELGVASDAHLTCPCGTRIPLSLAFKCFYCWIWFCRSCAERHFGKNSK